MGTRLIARGLSLQDDDPCLWNLSHPDVVRRLHESDLAAGSEALLTNTFGANRNWLSRYDRETEVRRINEAGVCLAREAGGPNRFVLGSIGPTPSEVPETYREQAEALLSAGADALVLETHRLDQAVVGLEILRSVTPAPILISLYLWPNSLEESVRRLEDLGADAIGVNCVPGMDAALHYAQRLRAFTPLPLFLKPSRNEQIPLADDVAFFGRIAGKRFDLGPILVGGCCGTTDQHVASLRDSW